MLTAHSSLGSETAGHSTRRLSARGGSRNGLFTLGNRYMNYLPRFLSLSLTVCTVYLGFSLSLSLYVLFTSQSVCIVICLMHLLL